MKRDDMGMGTARVLSREAKERLKKHASTPEYVALVSAVAKSLWEYRRQHPSIELRWKNTKGVLVLGDPEVRENLYRLADSEDAVEALVQADVATGKKSSLMTLQLALVYLGWTQ